MSAQANNQGARPDAGPEAKPVAKQGLARRVLRGLAWLVGSVLLLLVLLVVGFSIYSRTPDFQHRVGTQIVGVLDDATGGHSELRGLSFDFWHLAIEVDGLVIHGLEGPGEAPYLSAEKVKVRVKILSFLQHTTGTGVASHIGLSLLRVEAPHVHLIIDKNGKTNQPVPRHPTQSNTPVMDTLLDLKAQDVELVHGLALLNDRAIPFNLAAQDLDAQIDYLARSDRYGAVIDLRDLRTQIQKEPEAKSSLHVEAEVGRDTALLKAFDFHSGEHSVLQASASINHFNNPEWQAKVLGSLELRQIAILGGVDGLNAGALDLDLGGHNCIVAPAEAQKQPSFFQRRLKQKAATEPANKTLPPDPACQAGYLLVGNIKLHQAAYKDQNVRLHDINGGAQLQITPTQLLFTALTGYLPGGGSAKGELKIDNWLGEVPTTAPAQSPTVVGATTTANKTATAVTGQAVTAKPAPSVTPVTAHAYLVVTVDKIPLRTILDISAPKDYGDLGFDTAITGPVSVQWGGPATNIADTVQVEANLLLNPTGVRRRGTLSDIPVSGLVQGHYDGKTEVVNVTRLLANTPQSTLNANGVLGVNQGDPLTNLNVDLSLRDLSEYDQLLRTLGLTGNGKKGSAAIPVALHGSAVFHGTARGALAKLDVKGHLQANNLDVRLGQILAAAAPVAPPPGTPVQSLVALATQPAKNATPVMPAAAPVTDLHIDSLTADAEYTPAGLAVASSTVTQGTAVLHVAGAFKPRVVVKRKVTTYVWDQGTAIDASVQLANANVVDVLTIAGQQQKIPVTGTANVDAHVRGTLANLNGGGTLSLTQGVAYGEPFDSASAALTVTGKDVEASQVALALHGMSITGNGGYDLGNEHFHAHVQGNNLQLSKFKTVQDQKLNADGTITLNADANGTLTEPNLKAHVELANVVIDSKPIGQANIDAHSEGKLVFYTLQSTLIGTQIAGNGQTELTGNYLTKAEIKIAGLDVARPLALFQPGGLSAHSNISGVITINGPAATPMKLAGRAQFSPFDFTLNQTPTVPGLTFKAAEPLTIGLHDGLATLEQVHVTGPDTDLRAGGTAQVFGAVDPKTNQPDAKFGKLNVTANGSVSMALAHTFDPDLITSGKVTFAIAAGGIVQDPTLTGKVNFENVNLAVDGVPNGLSNMNGSLVFNQDRLNVENLTATTGGGQLKIGGFLTYRKGVYADLTATGDNTRVRLYGLSATANAKLRLQGGPTSALLSGNVLITRFGVGANVDFAAFAGGGGVQAPPDPAAAANKIRMDIHLTSAPQLDFQNSYAKLAGTVDLTVRGTVADPTVLGRIQITDGSATFAGTKYQLQRGDVYFTNPVRIDPTIDLDATARVENYDVTVGLHGTAANLKPTYRSEPPLNEADIFSLLALGRTQEESQLYQEQQVAAGTDPTTSSLLGGALNAGVSSKVSKLFGVGSVKIDPSYVGTLGNSSARITVQQQLSRQLTLTYATNVNSSSQQLIQVQYQLSDNVSIVAARDESGVFSIVAKLRKRYR